MNREDVVQAALTVERWCKEHCKMGVPCDCPLADGAACEVHATYIMPFEWNLEAHLRTKGATKHDD